MSHHNKFNDYILAVEKLYIVKRYFKTKIIYLANISAQISSNKKGIYIYMLCKAKFQIRLVFLINDIKVHRINNNVTVHVHLKLVIPP